MVKVAHTRVSQNKGQNRLSPVSVRLDGIDRRIHEITTQDGCPLVLVLRC